MEAGRESGWSRWSSLPERQRSWGDVWTAVAIAFGYTVLLALTDQMGFTRDESFYFKAGADYSGWFSELSRNLSEGAWERSFAQASIDRHWGYNPEHPVLMKMLFGLSWLVLHKTLGWLGPSLAFRLPAMVFAGVMVGTTWKFGTELFGRTSGWLAAFTLGVMPHVFFHSHLACFDVPITAMWVLVVYAYWRSLGDWRWAWVTGALWGVALTVKLNAFFLPMLFVAHAAWLGVSRGWVSGGASLRRPRIPLALVCMLLLGPLLLHAGWPLHWYESFDRLSFYFQFHLKHEHYYVDYFGRGLWEPPFPISYPFVLTGVTTPIVVLATMVLGLLTLSVVWGRERWLAMFANRPADGAGGAGRSDDSATGALLLLNIAFPFVLIALPSTPVFGGVKHWFPALPFMAVVAGYFLARVAREMGGGRDRLALVAVVAVYAPSPIYASVWSHPFGISYYNEVIGGVTGAADERTMRQFWGYAARQSLGWVNEHAVKGAKVGWHDSTWGSYDMYKQEGLLRRDVGATWDYANADYLLFDVQKALVFAQEDAWSRYGTQAPSATMGIHGVPLITVYENLTRLAVRKADADGAVAAEPEERGDGSGADGHRTAYEAEQQSGGSGDESR